MTALSLDNAVFHATATDAQIRHAIAKGRRGTPMPAFERRLSSTQLDGLVALIRSFARGRAENRRGEATIPDDGQARGSGLGPARQTRLATRVERKGVYVLNVTVGNG